jgi:hypothetical protein
MGEARSVRYLLLLAYEIRMHAESGLLPLATAPSRVNEVNGWSRALRQKLDAARAQFVEPEPAAPATAQRDGSFARRAVFNDSWPTVGRSWSWG